MKPALFLDRDGVINVNHAGRYCNKVQDFQLVPGIMSVVSHYRSLGYLPIVVTNQAGISHGFLTHTDLDAIHAYMLDLFDRQGHYLHAVYYCPCKDGPMRKPEPGMLLEAQRDHDIDMAASILIGDNITDIEAGRAAGVGCCILIPSNQLDAVPIPRPIPR